MFPFFDNQVAGAHGSNFAGCFEQGAFAGELTGLFVVDGEQIHPGDGFQQGIPSDIHPKVHGVHRNQIGPAFHLVQNPHLDRGGEVAEHQEAGATVGLGQDRVKIRQNIEPGFEGIAAVHVQMVFPGPKEGFLTGYPLNSLRINPPGPHHGQRFLRKIIPNHRNQPNPFRKMARRQGPVGPRPPNNPFSLAKRGFNAVKSDGSDNYQRKLLCHGRGWGL